MMVTRIILLARKPIAIGTYVYTGSKFGCPTESQDQANVQKISPHDFHLL